MGVSKAVSPPRATGQGEVGVFEKVDFVGGWKLYFSISAVLLLAGAVAIALGGLNFGIDFQGGSQFTVANAERQLSDEQVRAALPDDLAGESVVTTLGQNGYEVRTPVISSQEEQSQVRDSLSRAFGGGKRHDREPRVRPAAQKPGAAGRVAALLIIVVFISFRFEFAFALAAMAALVHDILITVGFYHRRQGGQPGHRRRRPHGARVLDLRHHNHLRQDQGERPYRRLQQAPLRRDDKPLHPPGREAFDLHIHLHLIPIVALLIFGKRP